MVEKEYNLEFATSMVHQFMPGFSSQKTHLKNIRKIMQFTEKKIALDNISSSDKHKYGQ